MNKHWSSKERRDDFTGWKKSPQCKLSECHLTMDNAVIEHRVMQAMPTSTRFSLSALFDLPPDKFAKLADTVGRQLLEEDFPEKNSRLRHTPLIIIALCSQPVERDQSQETAQPITLCSHSHPNNNPKLAAFTYFSLIPPNGVSPGGQTVISRTITRRRTGKRIAPLVCAASSNDGGSHMHPHCQQKRLTEN